MPLYQYTASQKDGVVVKGEQEAADRKTLAATLKQSGLLLLEAGERGAGGLEDSFLARANQYLLRFTPVKLTEKMNFSRNLGVMISAGLPISRALDALAQQTDNKRFASIITDVNTAISRGTTFADSLTPHMQVFGELFINMIEVGETTGKLPLILKLLARQMKKDYNLRRRVKGAMFYPAVVISALFIIGFLMMVYVVPSLTGVIKDLGAELPLSTKIIIWFSDLVGKFAPFVVIGVSAAVISLWHWLRTESGKSVFSHVILKVPLFGRLSKKFNTARFCRTMTYLITAGVPIVRSLEITANVIGNTLYKEATKDAAVRIEKGGALNEILTTYPKLFDPMVIQMISVGEETGNTSDMLLRLATFFEEEVSGTTKNLSTIIEPILMLFIGSAVAFFAIAMLQPIYGSLGAL